MTQKELNKILQLHKNWCLGNPNGVKADLSNADLSGLNLSRADLPFVNLYGANLYKADLTGADLEYAVMELCNLDSANLTEANLRNATLYGAGMNHAILTGACICGANLTGAGLRGARLENVRYSEYTSGFALCCPETGAFIGYKLCRDGRIVKLLIPEDAQRSSATSRKCRASKATVLEITDDLHPEQTYGYAVSRYDRSFEYRVGETVSAPDFDEDRWNECSPGIHFFLTRDEAIKYH